MMRLIIDDREKHVIPFFKEEYAGIGIEVKRINIGDYAIYKENQLLFIIERKTLNDLSASLRDGRKENINKLLLARAETGCKIIYLIEGKARPSPTKKFCRIPYKNLQAHLDHLIIRNDIFIIYSDSAQDTAARLIEFITNYMSLAPAQIAPHEYCAPGESPAQNDSAEMPQAPPQEKAAGDPQKFDLSQKISKPDLEVIYAIWRCVPGITDKTTSLFIQNYHISDLVLGRISKKEIAVMKYPNGVIIGKRATKIHKITESSPETFKIYCEMLACVNGITKKTAALIITKYGFSALLSGEITPENLALFKKTEKSTIGKKIASELLRFFVKQ